MQNYTDKNLTVVSVDETAKSIKVKLKDQDDQYSDILWCYASKAKGFTKDDFTVQDEKPATLNWVPDKEDPSKGFYGLSKWGDKTEQGQNRGGAGKSWQPKNAAEICSMTVCNTNTSAVAAVNHLATMGVVKDIKAYTEAYKALHAVILAESLVATNQLKAVCQ